MKSLLLTLAAMALTACSKSHAPRLEVSSWAPTYAQLLKTYVAPDGVRYAAWKASHSDLQSLDQVSALIAKTEPPADPKARLAFYIDAYNATVLHQVLSVFPINGVLEHDADFFKQPAIIAGERITLDHLENEIIRKEFHEPRIHFALNCASISCPPLLPVPYSMSDMDAVLEAQTRAYLRSTEGCEETAEGARVSQLFEWFADDFATAEGSAADFISNHRSAPLKGRELTFRPYNWNLNLAP
jgi:Protein of unknown function, DUF547